MRWARMPVAFAAGVVLLAALALLGAGGARVMPSFLAGWLFVLSVPLGALLLVTAGDAAGIGSPLLQPLRALLALMAPAALCGLPVLLFGAGLYHAGGWATGLGRAWFARGPMGWRMAGFLLLWIALAVRFNRPGRGGALFAFMLVLVTGALAAFDWGMAVEPELDSSAFGVLLLAGDAMAAIAAAALLAPGAGAASGPAMPMIVALSMWGFLHFSQFLVIWSANRPDEARWYLERTSGPGGIAVAAVAALLVAAPALLVWRRGAGGRMILAVAGLMLLARLVESFWLITPAFRGMLSLQLPDLLAALGLVALLVGVGPDARRPAHVGG